MIAQEDLCLLQKEISKSTKRVRGFGPQIHFVNDLGGVLKIVMRGTLAPVEKYFFQQYGQEYVDAVYSFYLDKLHQFVKELNEIFHNKYQFILVKWEPDFINDNNLYYLEYIKV